MNRHLREGDYNHNHAVCSSQSVGDTDDIAQVDCPACLGVVLVRSKRRVRMAKKRLNELSKAGT